MWCRRDPRRDKVLSGDSLQLVALRALTALQPPVPAAALEIIHGSPSCASRLAAALVNLLIETNSGISAELPNVNSSSMAAHATAAISSLLQPRPQGYDPSGQHLCSRKFISSIATMQASNNRISWGSTAGDRTSTYEQHIILLRYLVLRSNVCLSLLWDPSRVEGLSQLLKLTNLLIVKVLTTAAGLPR